VKKIRLHQQGIYEAPTGSGKTMTCIRFIQQVRPKNILILVDRLDLLNQWVGEFNKWLEPGGQVGQIGGGVTWQARDEKRITVATIQSIWRKRHDFPEWWWNKWDCVIVDECHHVTAESFQGIVSRFTAKWRFGVSATPDRKDDRFEIALDILGEVFHQEDEDELRKLGVLVKPHVEVVRTGFKFDYWPDHESDDDGECMIPGCKRDRKHSHRNNYQKLKDTIVFDRARNTLICNSIADEISKGKHHHIVISDEVRHLEALYAIFTDMYQDEAPPTYLLTGRVPRKQRQEIIQSVGSADEAVMFATVGKEGLDIPRLDRVYLTFPNSSGPVTKQKVGRITRSADGKDASVVFDFLDERVPKLKQQFRNRRVGCYNELGLEVRL
jgi:superfamily II DNA or RNA helicase